MCGICGVVNWPRRRWVDLSALEAMNEQLVHRGPDDSGFYANENVGLAMRRLSIIDVAAGRQPMCNEDGSVRAVYNGEIYNHRELRPALEARGHRFRTQCDTETLVHLYEEYGRECVHHLRGMFAFALWDARARTLFAARDRLGIKPFYYCLLPGAFLFASEIKALLAHPDVRAQMNHAALPEYLAFGYLTGGQTLFEGIRRLPPGHWLELDTQGNLTVEAYWDFSPPPNTEPRPRKHYVETYRGLLEQAVTSHLMSDVPLGVFLSGGIDSSAVAALATRAVSAPLQTFSVGYEEAACSELPYARAVAAHLGAEHHEVRVGQQEFFEALPKLIWHEDEPLAWPSSVSLYFVARLARRHVTVVLTGEGSDETLAGYTRYPWTLWNSRFDRVYRRLVPAPLRGWVRDSMSASPWLSAALKRKLSHTFLARDGHSWVSFYFDNFYSAFSEAAQRELLAEDWKPAPGDAYRGSLLHWEQASGDLLDRLLYTDCKTYLVELLMKQDNMSMAASVESRVPFLDHEVAEFALRIPSALKTRGLAGKQILKEAVRDLLPASILFRRKMGFPTPWRLWLAGPALDHIESLLISPRALERGLFQPAALCRLFSEQRAGRADHSDRLWRLLNLELWQRVFLDAEPVPALRTDKPEGARITA